MPDLWPENFGNIDVIPPLAILREQAAFLATKTNGLVKGHVETATSQGYLVHRFYVLAPALDNYQFLLFAVNHPITFYPLFIDAEVMHSQFRAESQEQFLAHLRTILSSEQSKRIIQALLAQILTPVSAEQG